MILAVMIGSLAGSVMNAVPGSDSYSDPVANGSVPSEGRVDKPSPVTNAALKRLFLKDLRPESA